LGGVNNVVDQLALLQAQGFEVLHSAFFHEPIQEKLCDVYTPCRWCVVERFVVAHHLEIEDNGAIFSLIADEVLSYDHYCDTGRSEILLSTRIYDSELRDIDWFCKGVGAHVCDEGDVGRDFRNVLELNSLDCFVNAVITVIRLGIQIPRRWLWNGREF